MLQLFYIQLFFPFIIQRLFQPFQALRQFLGIDRLEHILFNLQMNGFFGIFKFIKSGKNNNMNILIVLIQGSRQFQSVHIRHFYICDHHIRL